MKTSSPRPAGNSGALPELPVGNFPSNIRGVESITIIPQPPHAFSVVFCYPRRYCHDTFTLCRDGKLMGRFPRRLGVARNQVVAEVLRIAMMQNGNGNGNGPGPAPRAAAMPTTSREEALR